MQRTPVLLPPLQHYYYYRIELLPHVWRIGDSCSFRYFQSFSLPKSKSGHKCESAGGDDDRRTKHPTSDPVVQINEGTKQASNEGWLRAFNLLRAGTAAGQSFQVTEKSKFEGGSHSDALHENEDDLLVTGVDASDSAWNARSSQKMVRGELRFSAVRVFRVSTLLSVRATSVGPGYLAASMQYSQGLNRNSC